MKKEHYPLDFYTDAYYNPWDFVIDNYTFEIGGKNKQQKQIEKDGKSFVVKDEIEFGYRNVIPLWAFGMNY